GMVPFVDQNEVDSLEDARQVEGLEAVGGALELGIGLLVRRKGPHAMVADQVVAAPTVARLVDRHLMTAGHQLAGHSPQEVRVAVVPARHQRMNEHHDAHRRLLRLFVVSSRYAARYAEAVRSGCSSWARSLASCAAWARACRSLMSSCSAANRALVSSGETNLAASPHTSRRLGISPSTRAQPLSPASSAARPNGS